MSGPETNDLFLQNFFARIPADAAASFSDAQLDAIKLCFGARGWGRHRVDIRLSLPLIWRRYYLVVLAGAERRAPDRLVRDRLMHPVATAANAVAVVAFAVALLAPAALALYGLKSALGLDFFADGGGHALFENLFRQIEMILR
ncbi:MAG: hypothetical protein ACTSXZ_10840 [Alphaproteobacteria bacterium]